MASVSLLVVVAVAMLALSKCIFADEYVVGDNCVCTSPHLWNPSSSCDYNAWVGNLNFVVGDSIVFYYDEVDSNVAQVSESDYEACKGGHTSHPNSLTKKMSTSPTKFILNSISTFYFISTINCTSQHLSINVTYSSSSHRALQDESSMEPSPGPTSDPNSEVLPADGGTTDTTNSEPSNSNTPTTSEPSDSDTPTTPSPSKNKSKLVTAILGSVGGIVLLGAKLWMIRYCVQKRRNKKKKEAENGAGHNNGSIVNNHVAVMNVQVHHINHQTPADQKHKTSALGIPVYVGVPPKSFHANPGGEVQAAGTAITTPNKNLMKLGLTRAAKYIKSFIDVDDDM